MYLIALLSLYIVQRAHCSRLMRPILLGSQLLHFWPEEFAQSLGSQSAMRVVGRSSSTSTASLLWLHNLLLSVQL